ncbi:MAG: LptF/LptG family permease [bacterium]
MRTIYKYIAFELIPPFGLSVAVMTLILMLTQMFKLMEMIITKGVDFITVGELFIYYIPAIVILSVPMSMLVSSLMAFGRLSEDNEIIAMRACGISIYRLMVPVIIIAIILSGVMIYFHNTVVPIANHKFKNLLMDIGMKRPDLNIREGIFIHDFPGYKLYISDMNAKTGDLDDITIMKYDAGRLTDVIFARRGNLGGSTKSSITGDVVTMTLYDGEIHEMDPDKPEYYRRLRFSKEIINLYTDTALVRRDSDYKTEKEMTNKELEERLVKVDETLAKLKDEYEHEKDPANRERKKKQVDNFKNIRNTYLVEIYKKYSIPFATLSFIFFGVPFGVIIKRGGKGIGFGMSVIFFLIYYVFIVGGDSLGSRGIVPPLVAVWLPNIVFGLLGIFLVWRTANETETLTIGFNTFINIFGKIKRVIRHNKR